MYGLTRIRLLCELVWLKVEITRQILLEVAGNEF